MNRLSVLKYDTVSIALYVGLVSFGIINIYSSSFNESLTNLFDISSIVGKQVIFFFLSLIAFTFILFIKSKFIDNSTSIIYFLSIILLIGLFIFGVERGGAKSWYALGPISFQPSELAKFGTALFLSKFLSIIQTDLKSNKDIIVVLIIILVPLILTTIQPDPGTALIFLAFIFPVIREGLNLNYFYFGLYIILTLFLTLKFSFLVSLAILSIIFFTYLIYLRNKKFKISLLRFIFSFFILFILLKSFFFTTLFTIGLNLLFILNFGTSFSFNFNFDFILCSIFSISLFFLTSLFTFSKNSYKPFLNTCGLFLIKFCILNYLKYK